MKKLNFIPSIVMVLGFIICAMPLIASASDYKVVDLGDWQPSAINQSGQIVGTEADKGVFWENGNIVTLSKPLGRLALDINNSGQVVGQDNTAGAYVWDKNNGMQALSPINGASYKINDSGDIVGWLNIRNENRNIIWKNGVTIDLGGGAAGIGINNQGQVVFVTYDGGMQRDFLYDDGVIMPIGHAPTGSLDYFIPTALNDMGQIIGRPADWGAADKGFSLFYDGGVITNVQVSGSHTILTGLNNLGQAVGYGGTTPFLFQNGVLTNLNDLIPEYSDVWQLYYAYDINDDGEIVGVGQHFFDDGTRENRAFLLTTKNYKSVPEPTSILLFSLGLIGVAGVRRKFKK